jgi:hypothetical protein
MRPMHWGLILVVFLVAIVFDRFFPQLGNMVPGLPGH